MNLRVNFIQKSLVLFAAIVLPSATTAEPDRKVALDDSHTFRFATTDQATKLLGTADAWVEACGQFDRQIRVRSEEPVTQEAFLKFAVANVLDWDAQEITKMTGVIESMRAKITALSLDLDLPAEILLVQTTGVEEGNAGGYTRAAAIVIPERQLQSNPEQLESFMLHELFHVMTRHNPKVRIPIYELIGFQYCGEIEYPRELIPRRITNPDAFHFDACIELTVEERSVFLIPLTLSTSATYSGGGMFAYVTIEFLEVELNSGRATPKYVNSQPVLYEMGVVQGYMEKIGQNTGYIIHAEEILADNFTYAVQNRQGLPNPEIPAGIIEILAKK